MGRNESIIFSVLLGIAIAAMLIFGSWQSTVPVGIAAGLVLGLCVFLIIYDGDNKETDNMKIVSNFTFLVAILAFFFGIVIVSVTLLFPTVCEYDYQLQGSPSIYAKGNYSTSIPAGTNISSALITAISHDLSISEVSASSPNSKIQAKGTVYCRDLELTMLRGRN